MGVYIPDINKPHDCLFCRFRKTFTDICPCTGENVSSCVGQQVRSPNCPLKSDEELILDSDNQFWNQAKALLRRHLSIQSTQNEIEL